MPAPHRVRIVATAELPAGSASELAAVRLIALLPARWTCLRLECTPTAAVLSLTPPPDESEAQVTRAVDEVLTHSTLRGWARDLC